MFATDFTERLMPFPADLLPRLRELGCAARCCSAATSRRSRTPTPTSWPALHRLDLGEEWLRAVCWENAARLLDL